MSDSGIIGDQGFIALVNQLPIACILTCIRNNTVMAVNPAFEQLLGWPGERLVNHTIEQLPIWLSAEQRAEFFRELTRTGSLNQSETCFQCENGRVKPCLVYVEQIMVGDEACRLGLL